MIELKRIGMSGKVLLELIPETAEDHARLETMVEHDLVDARQSFADGSPKTPPSKTSKSAYHPPERYELFVREERVASYGENPEQTEINREIG